VPPLRERKEDIPTLAQIFLSACAKDSRNSKKALHEDAMDLLHHYDWPGNVRELKNLMERLHIMIPGDTLFPGDIPHPYNLEGKTPADSGLFAIESLKEATQQFKIEFLKKRISLENGNIQAAARRSGIETSYLEATIKEKTPKSRK
ncbi:MAG: sigma-54-dependent Fis family transcriptional regulator, partial [Desulfobacterium sp.]